jgi:hypothetical protein
MYAAVLGGTMNQACDAFSAIGGGNGNAIGNSGAASNSMIGGGESNAITGAATFIGAGYSNSSSGDDSAVAAGAFNSAGADDTFVGSGLQNVASASGSFVGAGGSVADATGAGKNTASGEDAFVGAGDVNTASGNGAFVGGGGFEIAVSATGPVLGNTASGTDSFIGAGDMNNIVADQSFIGGGQSNRILAGATLAAIGGGDGNVVSGKYGAVTGGEGNLVSGTVAAVPGGYHNVASGSASFAAGYVAEALTNGSFAWSDESSSTVHVRTTVANQFVARAAGGVDFYSNSALTSGVRLAPGAGVWGSLSDRTMKTGVVPLDDAAVLAKVAALPVSEWSYTSERGVRHVGPMAQDFYAAFGVGEDDRHITSIDEDGVALAAIKALHAENMQLRAKDVKTDADLIEMRERLDSLRSRDAARLADLERKVAALTNLVASHAGR